MTLGGEDTEAAISAVADTVGSGPPAVAPTVGGRVGRYEIVERIGAGAMGVVFRARDTTLARDVALKVLPPGAAGAGSARLLREAQAIAAVKHPNVVQVYDAGEDAGNVFIAMEFLEGRTFRAWLAEAKPSRAEILDAIRQTAAGLQAAHDVGVIHRDLKPDNLHVDDAGRLRVLDFGLAHAEPGDGLASDAAGDVALTRTGALMGTPAYMSPEQYAAEPLTPATDQWSLAVVLWEALSGGRPFNGDSIAVLAASVSRGDLPRAPARMPARIRRAASRALRVSPTGRFGTVADFAAALRPRAWIAPVALLGVAATGALAFTLTRDETTPPEPTAPVASEESPSQRTHFALRELGMEAFLTGENAKALAYYRAAYAKRPDLHLIAYEAGLAASRASDCQQTNLLMNRYLRRADPETDAEWISKAKTVLEETPMDFACVEPALPFSLRPEHLQPVLTEARSALRDRCEGEGGGTRVRLVLDSGGAVMRIVPDAIPECARDVLQRLLFPRFKDPEQIVTLEIPGN